MFKWVKAARELRRATDKIGNTVGIHPITRREYNLAIRALHEISDNMPPDQQERRIMATINGTKVLIVVTREMPKKEE